MRAIIGLILPVILLLSAYLIKFKNTKDNNSFVFYRSKNAKKSEKSLKIANQYAIRLLIGFSWISILVSLITAFALKNESISTQIINSVGIVSFSIVFTIVSTEKYLKIIFKE